MVVIVLTLTAGAALLIVGIHQGEPSTAIFGATLIAFIIWALASGSPGGDDDWGDAGDGDA